MFSSQKSFWLKTDWVLQVQSDLDECDVKEATGSYKYNDIFFSNLEIQTKLIKTWQAIMKVRKLKLKNISD